MSEMKKEFYTGIDFIDEEHSKLFDIIEEANGLLKNECLFDKYDQIRVLLDSLLEYASEHFAHEEEYMERIQYKRLFTQKMEQKMFIEKVESVDLAEMDERQEETVMELLVFLYDWLKYHILEKDMLISETKE